MIGICLREGWRGAILALFAVVFLSAATAAEPPQAVTSAQTAESDIVVLGRRLQNVSVQMSFNRRGQLQHCAISKPTGDAELDRFWCDAGQACAAARPNNNRAMGRCMEGRKQDFLRVLAATRSTRN